MLGWKQVKQFLVQYTFGFECCYVMSCLASCNITGDIMSCKNSTAFWFLYCSFISRKLIKPASQAPFLVLELLVVSDTNSSGVYKNFTL